MDYDYFGEYEDEAPDDYGYDDPDFDDSWWDEPDERYYENWDTELHPPSWYACPVCNGNGCDPYQTPCEPCEGSGFRYRLVYYAFRAWWHLCEWFGVVPRAIRRMGSKDEFPF